MYVVVTCPLASVVPDVDESGPQEPGLLGDVVKVTWSPVTATPDEFFTVAVIVEWVVPSGGTALGEAVTVTVLDGVVDRVWMIVALPDAPVAASVAVIVQLPDVFEVV